MFAPRYRLFVEQRQNHSDDLNECQRCCRRKTQSGFIASVKETDKLRGSSSLPQSEFVHKKHDSQTLRYFVMWLKTSTNTLEIGIKRSLF